MPSLRPAKRTQVGTPKNQREIITRFDALLRRLGIDNENLRRAYTAHAMGVAIGLQKQNCWWYNCFAVKRGKGDPTQWWNGDWYVMGTVEEDTEGETYSVPKAEWRAFDSWGNALKDTLDRIGPSSWNEYYVQAYEAALKGDCYAYWERLGAGPPGKRYYTDTHWMKPKGFASLCAKVESNLTSATGSERAAAEAWVDEQARLGVLGPSAGPAPFDPSDKPTGYILAGVLAAIAAVGAAFFAFWKK